MPNASSLEYFAAPVVCSAQLRTTCTKVSITVLWWAFVKVASRGKDDSHDECSQLPLLSSTHGANRYFLNHWACSVNYSQSHWRLSILHWTSVSTAVFTGVSHQLTHSSTSEKYAALLQLKLPNHTAHSLFQCVLRFVKQLGSSLATDTSESMIISLSHHLLPATAGGVVYSLVEVVHIPYCQQLVQFGSLEQQLLMRKLNESKMVCDSRMWFCMLCLLPIVWWKTWWDTPVGARVSL